MMPRIGELDPRAELTDVLLWSDNEAERMTRLIELKNEWYKKNVIGFTHDWLQNVFNIDTADTFGISVWARILGIPLNINLLAQDDQPTFGFEFEGDYQPYQNYDHGNFTSREGFHVGLTIEQTRLLLKLRYLKLIARPSVPYINRMLNIAFGRQNVYVLDPLDMSFAVYVFNTEPGRILRLIVDYFDLLPRPSCVGVRIVVDREGVFGFSEVNENFEDANFITEVNE